MQNGCHICYAIFNTGEKKKFVDKIFAKMRAGGKIGENFLLAKISSCTVFVLTLMVYWPPMQSVCSMVEFVSARGKCTK